MKILMWLSIGLDRRTPSEHILSGIIESLYKQGHSVHVLQKNTNGPLPPLYEYLMNLGVTTMAIPCKHSRRSNLLHRYLSDVIYILKCRKHLKKYSDYDAVFLQSSNVAGFQVYQLKRILPSLPITFNVQDIFPENAIYSGTLKENGFIYRILSKLQRYAYSYSRNIITISEDMKDTLASLGVPENRIHVIYNWSYQDEPFDKSNLDLTTVAHIFNPKHFNVLYAGNIGRMQNVEVIIKAAALMKNQNDIWFHVVGDGVYKKKLVQKAKDTGVKNISFWPFMEADKAPALYYSADINIIPLAKNIFRTALPSKTATCLACAKPIVFCMGKHSRFANIVSNNTNCLVVESDDANDVRNALLLLQKNQITCDTITLYKDKFNRTINSKLYADVIGFKNGGEENESINTLRR